ncbi:hypothetical protein LSTR_LSTR011359 [Laodelphax striatellus]|uniref:Chitin-binding type-2 domain-containing protein n=1 Tax=Laodelphax striatellus TaxID=195883 RepID=A0A482X7T9_LAOST|nr:hypothetical protein LSTR_LSTR011359 [Laodelphax striatellus]
MTVSRCTLVAASLLLLLDLGTASAHLQQYQPSRQQYQAPRQQYQVPRQQFRPFFRQTQSPVEPAPQNLSPADQKKFNDYQRQIQQWQIAVVVPPGSGAQVGPQAPAQGGYPPAQGGYPPASGGYPQSQAGPGPAPPGNVWIQVPAGSGTYYPSSGSQYPAPSPVDSGSQYPAPSPVDPGSQYPAPSPVDAGSQYPPAPPPSQNEVSPPSAIAAPPPEYNPPPPEVLPAPVSEQPYPEPLPPPSNELPPATGPAPSPVDSSALKAFCKAPRGQFPSASCDKFVNCWDDFVVEQDCPAGLYFNEGGFCDYPYNVDCSARQPGGSQPGSGSVGGGSAVAPPPSSGFEQGNAVGGPVVLPPPESPPPGSEYPPPAPPAPGAPIGPEGGVCPSAYGTYRSKTNCGAFSVCVAGKPYEFICPAGLNFHEDLKVCDYPYRVECNGVPTNPAPPEPSPEEQAEPSGEAAPPAPVAESPAPAPAPAPVAPAVDPSLAGYFGQRKYYSQYPNYKSAAGNLQCYGRSNIMYRLTPTCSTVAICQGGIARVLSCPQGMRFDSPTRRCMPAYRARC